MTTAFVFPGQGSQKAGMGRDFHDAFEESRRTFEEAAEALDLDIGAICFAPDDERLGLTEYQQPAILVTEVAMMRALGARFELTAELFGGHSLGEYSALVAAGVIPLAEAARLVRERGRLMQEAVAPGTGKMVALVHKGADAGALEDTLVRTIDGLGVDVANRNAPTQLVLSGSADDIDRALERIGEEPSLGRVRAIPLRVSAPFHSRWMAPVAEEFRATLEASAPLWSPAGADSVTSNYRGAFHAADAEALVEALTRQIAATVRWTDNMQALADAGARVIEVGPGKPLRALFAAVDIETMSITDLASAQAASAAPG